MNTNDNAHRRMDSGAPADRSDKTRVRPSPAGVLQLAIVAAIAVAAGLLVFPI